MCGLVWVLRKDGRPASKSVIKRYRKQQSRGQSGFGYVAIKDNKVVSYQRAQFEHEILEKLKKETAPEILFHHRYPTNGPNIAELAHPLPVSHESLKYSYLIAHNGVIRNSPELRKEHEKDGFKYKTLVKRELRTVEDKIYVSGEEWNDSESLAIETARAIEGQNHAIKTTGAAAVIGLKLEGDRVVERFFYRNQGNPLVYQTNVTMTSLVSVGTGTPVSSIYVYRFVSDDGSSFEEIPRLFTPYTYTQYSSNYSLPPLPARTESKDDDAQTALPLNLLLPSKELTTKEIVSKLDTPSLWSQYESMDNRRVQLKEALDKLMDASKRMPNQTDTQTLYSKWNEELTRLKNTCDLMENELLAREAFTPVIIA